MIDIRNRVVEMRVICAKEIQDNDGNWRFHPKFQRDSLRGTLTTIGIADVLKAYYSERQGGLTFIDGHLRKEDYPDISWPTLILDVNDAEADVLLATLDPIAALAQAESSALDALLKTVETESEAVKALLEGLAEQEGLSMGEPVADPGAQARVTLAERFVVPPFSVLDARQGYWQERKRAWIALGIQSEIGRGGAIAERERE